VIRPWVVVTVIGQKGVLFRAGPTNGRREWRLPFTATALETPGSESRSDAADPRIEAHQKTSKTRYESENI